MPLIKCPDCQKEFSDLAAACPNCARPNFKPAYSKPLSVNDFSPRHKSIAAGKEFKPSLKPLVWDVPLTLVFGIGLITALFHLLKYLSEFLIISPRMLKLKSGLFSNQEVEIPYDKINAIKMQQSLFGMMLGYGTLIVYTGNDISGIKLINLDNPQQIKTEIQTLIPH